MLFKGAVTIISTTGIFLFNVFPQNEKLRKVCLRKISRKGFKPTSGHRVCSEHFEGGKKMYMNNIPTIFPLKTHQS